EMNGASGREGADENARIDAGVVKTDIPVQMWARGAAGGTDLAKDVAARQLVADLYADVREMAEHADQSLAVVDKDRLAVEEVVAGEDDLAGGRCLDRRAGWRGEVQAGMRIALLIVEKAAQAKRRGQRAVHRPVE